MSLGGGASSALDNAVAQLDHLRRQLRDRCGQLECQRVQLLACPRRRQPTRSAQRPAPTLAPRSPTTGRAWTSSRRARASRRPGARATPRRTRSAGPRWRRRTWPARSRSTSRRTRRISGDRDPGARRELDAEQGHESRHRVSQPAAVLDLRRRAAAASSTSAAGPPPPPPPPPPRLRRPAAS